ncbi:MAG: IPT/TIG domain-containing protein, partial [Gaiellaceae bacterium]
MSSNRVTLEVTDKTPPELSLSSSPGAGKVGAGTTITITANATDNVGVQKLTLAAGGEAVADGRAQTFDCSSQMTCSNTFTVTMKRDGFVSGEVSVVVNASDATDNESHQDLAFDVSTKPQPMILSVAPSPASPGQAVAITGTAFGENQDGSTVTVGGIVPPITGWSDTIIAVIVPDLPGGIVPVVVTTQEAGSAAGALTILGSGPPMITGIAPAQVPPKGMVTITGTSFGAMQAGTVDVAGGDATVISWSDTAITFTVPEGTPLGPVAVAVVVHGVRSNEVGLTIKGPGITSVSPDMANPGDTVTITGTDFGAMQGSSAVTIGGSGAGVTSWSDTSIVATVPQLMPGPVKVVVTVNS